MNIEPVAYIRTDFSEKFGIPRQSGRVGTLRGKIVFTEKYRDGAALDGIENFSHLWLIFDFSKNHREHLLPTVRPPRLGGNKRVGVFASRSPFRENFLGLSCVKLEKKTVIKGEGTVLFVTGADLLDGTPIYDIKPYIPYCDCVPSATGSYSDEFRDHELTVTDENGLLSVMPSAKAEAAVRCIADDPRTGYNDDPERIWGMTFSGYNIRFTVNGTEAVIKAVEKTGK